MWLLLTIRLSISGCISMKRLFYYASFSLRSCKAFWIALSKKVGMMVLMTYNESREFKKPIRTVFASTHSDTAMRVPLRITYLEKELAVDCLGVITPGCRFGQVLSQLLVVNGCLIDCLCIELFEARNVYRADITKGDDFLLAF